MDSLDFTAIRSASLKTAARLGYPTNRRLPLLDEPSAIREEPEILDRILAMHCVAACSYRFARDKALEWYMREASTNALTEGERVFLQSGVGDRRRYVAQIEGLWALTWVVGIVPHLDFGEVCSPQFVTMLPDLKTDQSSAGLRSQAAMRPLEQIVAACDLSYCLHWAVRQAAFRNATLPQGADSDVVVERRRALEWVLCSEDWDCISLDT